MISCSILLGGSALFSWFSSAPADEGVCLRFLCVSFIPYVYDRSYYAVNALERGVLLQRWVFDWIYVAERLARGKIFNSYFVVSFWNNPLVTLMRQELFAYASRMELWRVYDRMFEGRES